MTKHWLRGGVIHCDGATIAECHIYPDCGCEYWSDEHEAEGGTHARVQHQDCWMAIEANRALAESYACFDWEWTGVPNRTEFPDGEVTLEWDDYVMWDYVEAN